VTMKQKVEMVSYVVILGGSMILGLIGRPVEMGLAIVAGAIVLSFANLEKFSRIKGAGFEADLRLMEQIAGIVENEIEPDVSGESKQVVPNSKMVDQNARLVINALRHHEYTWRYISGLKKDTRLSTEAINKSIEWLIQNNFARQSLGSHGTMWCLTEDGRYLHTVIAFEDVKA